MKYDPQLTLAAAQTILSRSIFGEKRTIDARDRILAHEKMLEYFACEYEHEPTCRCRHMLELDRYPVSWRTEAHDTYWRLR